MSYRATLSVALVSRTELLNADAFSDDYVFENPPVPDGQQLIELGGRACYSAWDKRNPNTDSNVTYLANIIRQGHYSVLEHANVGFFITGVSRTLTHELVRHRHFSYSQMSQRFVNSRTLKIVVPPAIEAVADHEELELEHWAQWKAERAIADYDAEIVRLKKSGVTGTKALREAARSHLPNCTETKILVTGNYRAWIEFLVKRTAPAADAEIRRLASRIEDLLAIEAPGVFGTEARPLWDRALAQGESRV